MAKYSQKDIGVLRRLAGELAEIAALPVHKEKAVLWRKLNNLEKVRPLVLIDEIPWHEMNVGDELTLQTHDERLQKIETGIRRKIYQWKHMPADMVISDYIPCPLVFSDTGFGISEDVDITMTDKSNDVVSRHFKPQISCPEDIEKIKMPVISYDEQATEENYGDMCKIFDGIMAVEKEGVKHIWFTPWDNLIRWWGIQEAMMDMMLRPEMVNSIVAKVVDSCLCGLEQMERLGLLTLGNDNTRIGSGGYGYVDGLAEKAGDSENAKPQDMWGCSNAQIFAGVSPAMHWEFALSHEMRWLAKWGLTYYGCCEPLDGKMEILKKIPNLRKISMSPWIDLERAVKNVGQDYVFSRKPNPAILAETQWNPDTACHDISSFLDKAKDCRVEIILKDISTVRYKPQRLWQWQKIAMDLVEKFN